MPNTVIWGTSLAPASFSTRQRATSEGDLRVTSDGDIRIAYVPPPQVIFLRKDSDGNQRVTSAGDRRVVINGLQGPQYFQTANVTTDGGEPFEFSHTTNPWQPSGGGAEPTAQGGESVFKWAYVTLSWSMSATIRLSGIVDGSDQDITLDNGDVVQNIRTSFVLAQQGGSLQRQTAMFPIPLLRRTLRGDNEVLRVALRGQRLQLLIESTGALGVGELMLEGVQVDFDRVRKAIYLPVVSQ